MGIPNVIDLVRLYRSKRQWTTYRWKTALAAIENKTSILKLYFDVISKVRTSTRKEFLTKKRIKKWKLITPY